MLKTLMPLLSGLLIGAAGFHAYYLGLGAERRCGWDHPFDDSGRAACRAAASGAGHGYSSQARQDMNSLINEVAQ